MPCYKYGLVCPHAGGYVCIYILTVFLTGPTLMNHGNNEHTKHPVSAINIFSTKRDLNYLNKWQILCAEKEKYKLSL